MTKQEYYDKFFKSGDDGKCKICCGKTTWDNDYSKYRDYCGYSCRAKGCNNKEMWTVDLRKRLSDNKKEYFETPEGVLHKSNMSANRLGDKNPVHKQSLETRQRMSKNNSLKMKQNILDGKFTPPATNSWANSRCIIPNSDIKFRSTWEAVFYIINKQNVEYETLRIPYIDELGRNKIYIVDFIDTHSKIVYEVKPERNKFSPRNVLKEYSLKQWCFYNSYIYECISDDYFKEHAKNIDYSIVSEKIKKGMKQFL